MAYKPPANLSKTFLDRPPPNWKDLTAKVTIAVKAVDAAVRSLSHPCYRSRASAEKRVAPGQEIPACDPSG